jgi:hypothetical protein
MGKMFQTTNQITIIFPLLLVYSLLTTINHHYIYRYPDLSGIAAPIAGQAPQAPRLLPSLGIHVQPPNAYSVVRGIALLRGDRRGDEVTTEGKIMGILPENHWTLRSRNHFVCWDLHYQPGIYLKIWDLFKNMGFI